MAVTIPSAADGRVSAPCDRRKLWRHRRCGSSVVMLTSSADGELANSDRDGLITSQPSGASNLVLVSGFAARRLQYQLFTPPAAPLSTFVQTGTISLLALEIIRSVPLCAIAAHPLH